MREDFHIDMSGRIYEKRTIGIACLGVNSRTHNGCALRGRLIKRISSELCTGEPKVEDAMLYAICIFFLIKNRLNDIKSLTICNDEDIEYVRRFLMKLLGGNPQFKIRSISELRKILGRDISSPADNFANRYRRRALQRNKWDNGTHINVCELDFKMIEDKWKNIK